MPRTTDELVAGVVKVKASIDLAPFIGAANGIVTDVCQAYWDAQATGEERLVTIETWLAAHFYAVRDPQKTRAEADVIRATYETNKVDFDLRLTRYGQQAIAIDTSGLLAAYNNSLGKVDVTPPGVVSTKPKPSFVWLGTDPDLE